MPELLSEGRTNRGIADELVISNGTVKLHVNSILRKLRVGNRVEAVARYYALLGSPPRDSYLLDPTLVVVGSRPAVSAPRAPGPTSSPRAGRAPSPPPPP